MTTAYLTLRLYLGGDEPKHRVVHFDRIMDEVKSGAAAAGVLIHEGQLTYEEEGFHLVEDLGVWWKNETGGPLPLGCNVIRKDLGAETMRAVSRILGESINYALGHREEALDYAMAYARDLPRDKADQFVGMYVNDWTRAYGEAGREAVRTLLSRAAIAGLVPEITGPEFVE